MLKAGNSDAFFREKCLTKNNKVSGVISDLKEIPEILGLRAFRVIRDLLDLKEIKGPLDPRVIQDL